MVIIIGFFAVFFIVMIYKRYKRNKYSKELEQKEAHLTPLQKMSKRITFTSDSAKFSGNETFINSWSNESNDLSFGFRIVSKQPYLTLSAFNQRHLFKPNSKIIINLRNGQKIESIVEKDVLKVKSGKGVPVRDIGCSIISLTDFANIYNESIENISVQYSKNSFPIEYQINDEGRGKVKLYFNAVQHLL
ncbi:hypothetical protein [Flammeovirga sp. SJP92]|uniref:hypothetical protein n=1 Tax=Flammeovirga sp. SJP92 TaxID=1775430 RepID=UPI0007869CBD|nr:hypothetical protein [Flammeovirga sp. SJP92]KXX72739.1 hypothetical protein AVL50_32075 [Flammeovirga sp. SJP92]